MAALYFVAHHDAASVGVHSLPQSVRLALIYVWM